MDFQQIRKYVKGVLTNSFINKTTLDKLSTSDEGNLLFDGKKISGNSGSETSNYFYLIDYNSMESLNSRDFTAEKDCYIEVETYANDNKEEHYYINDIFVGRESINGEVIYLKSFFLSKGDNLKLREGVSHSTTIRIFDLLDNKHNYSIEEKVVGKWIDGKPIYEKTYVLNDINLSTGNNIFDTIENVKIINSKGTINGYSVPYADGGEYVMPFYFNNEIGLWSNKGFYNQTINIILTINYIKTTD